MQVEQAGGASSCDGKLISALNVPINDYDQRSQVCFGSTTEVQRFEEYVYGKYFCRIEQCKFNYFIPAQTRALFMSHFVLPTR